MKTFCRPCPRCSGCGVCMDFHDYGPAHCGESCPYRWYHRIRDRILRGAIAIWDLFPFVAIIVFCAAVLLAL